jgi:hypothetical protein
VSRTAVVIAGWSGHPIDPLIRLLDSIDRWDAGAPFDLVLSANGLDFRIDPEVAARFAHVFVRENTGYNIGAWDHAWRLLPNDRFLFLQDECFVRTKRWLAEFEEAFDRAPRCGIVGEHSNRAWDKPWDRILATFEDRDRAQLYLDTIVRWGIPPGRTARHITTVVQYTSREVLLEVGGYPIGSTYAEAIAAEIGFSRKVEAADRRLLQIGPRRHSRIGHPQWPADDLIGRLSRSLAKRRG